MLEYLSYAGEILLLANLVVLFFSPNKTSAHLALAGYLGFVLVIQLYSHWLRNHGQNNLYLSHILFPGQWAILVVFCYLQIRSAATRRWLLLANVLPVIGAGGFILLSMQDFYVFNKAEILLTNISVIVALFMVFYDNLGRSRYLRLSGIGLLVYFMCSTIVFIGGSYITQLGISGRDVWLVNILLFLLSQLLILADGLIHIKQLPRSAWKQQ